MKIRKVLLVTLLSYIIPLVLLLISTLILNYSGIDEALFGHYMGISLFLITLSSNLIILLWLLKFKVRSKNMIHKVNNLKWGKLVFVGIVSVGLVFFVKPFFDIRLIIGSIKNEVLEPLSFNPTDYFYYLTFCSFFFAPVFEELIFRKYIFSLMLNKYSILTSLLVSSILFALIHIPDFNNLLPTFFLGLVCSLVYLGTNNLIYSIILHFIYNFLMVTQSSLGVTTLNWLYQVSHFDYRYWIVIIFFSSIGLIFLRKLIYPNTQNVEVSMNVK